MKAIRIFITCGLFVAVICQAGPPPEAGPANGGMRLRLTVDQDSAGSNETYRVQVDLINVSAKPITLTADWPYENKGDFKDYLEAAFSIETDPPIRQWEGQVRADHRNSPQPEYVLESKKALHVEWRSSNRQLKNQVTRPLEVQNPRFPTDGLYSVHGVIVLKTSDGVRMLRSNDQLISVGGCSEMPKYPLGTVYGAEASNKTGIISLGSLHKITTSDRFLIRTGMSDFWCLTISHVEQKTSSGNLVTSDWWGRVVPETKQLFPKPGMIASLITEKPPGK
jgi:hypothetical protein